MANDTTAVAQLFNYYPKYAFLDNELVKSSKKKINFYVDFKNCCQSLYQEWAIRYIVDQTQGATQIDCSVFGSFLEFLSFHKTYLKKRGIEGKFYVFLESGKSQYHLNIDKNYKCKRGITDMFNLPALYLDTFMKVFTQNINTIYKVGNKIPGVNIFKLDFFEADFIPYYIMNYINKDENDSLNMIYSTDKDMMQCLGKDNTVQYFRHFMKHKFISRNNMYRHYFKLKDEEELEEIDPLYFPLLLSILGDDGDGVSKHPNFKGLGTKTFIDQIYRNIPLLVGTPQKMYANYKENKKIFSIPSSDNKWVNKLLEAEDHIVKNMRLTSFEIISDYIEGQFPTNILEKRKYIWEIAKNQNKIREGIVLESAMKAQNLDGLISQQSLYSLFN